MTDFQIATYGIGEANLETGEVATAGIAVIDLDEMASHITPTVLDPTIPMVETDDPSRPATATPTNGPHRYTVVVPNKGGNGENSIFSVGQAGPADRIRDTGITAMTRTHIHWHTVDAPQTMVLLGGPTAHHGWEGPNGADNPATNSGYMVVTEGLAWQESRGHQYLLSKDGDAVLRSAGAGKRVVLQADQGEMDLVAKTKLYAIAPGVNISAPVEVAPVTTTNYGGSWTADMPKVEAGKASKTALTVIGVLTSAHDLFKKAPKIRKKFKEKKAAWESEGTDIAKWTLDAYKAAATGIKTANSIWADPAPKPGVVKVSGEDSVAILGGSDVSLWGGTGVSAGGTIWAGLTAGVSASVKSSVWAGIGSMYTSLKGYRKVEMSSDYGKASVKAAKELELTSEEKSVKISAKTTAQMISDDVTFVQGKGRTVVGAGPMSSGTGMVATQDAVKIGMMTNIGDAAAADTDDTAILMSRNSHMKLKWADSSIVLESGKIETTTGEVKIWAKSGNASINGSKILLG